MTAEPLHRPFGERAADAFADWRARSENDNTTRVSSLSSFVAGATWAEAAERDRLRALNKTLVEALEESIRTIEWMRDVDQSDIAKRLKDFDASAWTEAMRELVAARAALAAAREEAS